MNDALVLYHFPLSTTSQKVRLCQHYKEIALDERLVDITRFEQLAPRYLALNPNGQVPTLVASGRPIVESSIINEYLEERFPDRPLLPRDPTLRAHIRAWTKYVDASPTVKIALPTYRAWVAPSLAGIPEAALLAEVGRVPDETTRDRWLRTVQNRISDRDVASAYDTLEAMFARMEGLLEAGPWLFGPEYTLADVETLPIVVRVQHLGRTDLLEAHPRVMRWLERAQGMANFEKTYAFLREQARAA